MVGAMQAEAPPDAAAPPARARPPRSTMRSAMHVGVVALVAVSIGIVALTVSSTPGDNVELLATQHGISRSAVEGDGFVDSAWSDVWKRKPAQFKAVSQELSSYDEVGSKSAGSTLDASQTKAEHELAGYLQVTKSLLAQKDTTQPKASTDPKAIKQIPASQWSAKQQLEDAEAHDQELNTYSNILSFSPKDTAPEAAPKAEAAKAKGGSYNVLDFPFPAYKAWYTSKTPAEKKAPSPTAMQLEAKEKTELNSYDLLNFPTATQKKVAQPAEAAPHSKAKAAEGHAAAAKAALPAHAAAKTSPPHAAAKAAVAAQRPAAVAAQEEEDKKYANPTPFTGLLEVGAGAAAFQSPLPAAPQPAAILIEPPPASGSSALAQKWRAVWAAAEKLQQMALHPQAQPQPQAQPPAPPHPQAKQAPAPAAAPSHAAAATAAPAKAAKVAESGEKHADKVRAVHQRVQAQEEEQARCDACAAVWTEEARVCVESCTAQHAEAGLTAEDREQLRINDGVARLLREYLGRDAEGGGGKQVLVQGFVSPAVEGGVPSWVAVEAEHEGLRGLGLASGRSVSVALHGVETLSAKRLAKPGSAVSLEAALAPLMAAQRKLNEARVRAGAHVLEGFAPPASILAWKPHPGYPLPAHPAPQPQPQAKALQTALAALSAARKPPLPAHAAHAAEASASAPGGGGVVGVRGAGSQLSSDPVVRALQLKARALSAQLHHHSLAAPAHAPAPHTAHRPAASRDTDRALAWVLAQKEVELARAEALRQGKGGAGGGAESTAARVKGELAEELAADEAKLREVDAAAKREEADGRLIAEEARSEGLQARHDQLQATLRRLRRALAAGDPAPAKAKAKAPEQMLSQLAGKGAGAGAGQMGAVEALAEQLSEATRALAAARGGHVHAADKASALHAKLARARGSGGALSEAGRAARMRAALAEDEAALDRSADYLPALSDKPHHRFAVPRAPAKGAGGNGDGALRADVKALLGATKVADPAEYDAMLGAAIAKEQGAVARYRHAQRFASHAIDRDLSTADDTFDAQPRTAQAVAHAEADPAVAAAMRAAHRIEREMHIAFPHADQRKAAAAAARRREQARKRAEERAGKFIPGIGQVRAGEEGQESLSSQLWKHHLVPVQQAVAQAAPPLTAPRDARQPKLAADGGLRAKERRRAAGKAPSGWSVAGKEGERAVTVGKSVEGDVASGLGWALGGLTEDKREAQSTLGGAPKANTLWSYF